MHIIQSPNKRRTRKRMYLPSERMVVNGVGLGDLEGMFNIGKMFKRMVTITPGSFKLKNIMGAIGSVTATVATGGLGLALAPKIFGAHAKEMKAVGYATAAVAAVAGAVVAAPMISAGMTSL